MTDGYDRYQNALAERMRILKMSFYSRPADPPGASAREIVKESVAIYNHERHQSPEYKTPMMLIRRFTDKNCQPISGLVR